MNNARENRFVPKYASHNSTVEPIGATYQITRKSSFRLIGDIDPVISFPSNDGGAPNRARRTLCAMCVRARFQLLGFLECVSARAQTKPCAAAHGITDVLSTDSGDIYFYLPVIV